MRFLFFINAIVLCLSSLYADDYQYSLTNYDQESASESTVKVVNHPRLGKILTDNKGRTLYMFTPDKNQTSQCYGQCSVAWPPFVLSSGQPVSSSELPGNLGVINRRDNTQQVTYNGMPLYYYIKDTKPGDTKGQRVDNQWYVINPDSGPNKDSQNNDYRTK